MTAEALGEAWGAYPGNPGRTIVLLAVGDIVNDTHGWELWASSEKLATKTGLSAGNVRNHLAALVDDGWLEVLEPGGGKSRPTRYRWLKRSESNRAETRGSENPTADTARERATNRADTRGQRTQVLTQPVPTSSGSGDRAAPDLTDAAMQEFVTATLGEYERRRRSSRANLPPPKQMRTRALELAVHPSKAFTPAQAAAFMLAEAAGEPTTAIWAAAADREEAA